MKVKKNILGRLSRQQLSKLYDFVIEELEAKSTHLEFALWDSELNLTKSIRFLPRDGKNFVFSSDTFYLRILINSGWTAWGPTEEERNATLQRLQISRDKFHRDYQLDPLTLEMFDTNAHGKTEQIKNIGLLIPIVAGLDEAIFNHLIYQTEFKKPKVTKLYSFGPQQYANIAYLAIDSVFNLVYKKTKVTIGAFEVEDQIQVYHFCYAVDKSCKDPDILYLMEHRVQHEQADIDRTGQDLANAIEAFASLMLGETWRDQLSLIENEDFQRLLEIYYPIGAVNLISNFNSVRVLATKNAKEKMNEVS